MDKIKKAVAVIGWVGALVLAAYIYFTDYVAQNPFPTDPQVQEQAQ